ncbi:hypothetical protein [uncultured Arcticibacterium sp.]|uniref:hypothetical protein n=1 Tax=uncultured Arcticibacterium sp. TaxID=2173042 RepID=UPI0030FAF261
MHIQFQTSDLVPPPYAYAVEIHLEKKENGEQHLDFELSYLDRDGLSKEEIYDEGFSEDDDLKWSGDLNEDWSEYIESIKSDLHLIKKSELRSGDNFWQITHNKRTGYPDETEHLSIFIQELQQAAFEAAEREAPLLIRVLRISNEERKDYSFEASFKERTYSETLNGQKKSHPWDELNIFLKDVFSGDFRPEQASKKAPRKSGLFLSIGDELWYELGKSYLIQPSKIQQYLS